MLAAHREEYTLSRYVLNVTNYADLLGDRSAWPVGYDLIIHILVNNLPRWTASCYIDSRYRRLHAAYTAPTLDHIHIIPKDLQSTINRYLTKVHLTGTCRAVILGQDITIPNGPYRVEYCSSTSISAFPKVRRAYWDNFTLNGVDYGEIDYFEPNIIEFRTIWPSICGPMPASGLPYGCVAGFRRGDREYLRPLLNALLSSIIEYENFLLAL